jgi:hypothetical protein
MGVSGWPKEGKSKKPTTSLPVMHGGGMQSSLKSYLRSQLWLDIDCLVLSPSLGRNMAQNTQIQEVG